MEPSGNIAAQRRLQARDCLDAQIMKSSGEASGRLDTPILEGPKTLPEGPVNSLEACCEMMRTLGIAQLNMLNAINNNLKLLGQKITIDLADNLLIPTRDSISFLIPGNEIIAPEVSGGSFTTVSEVKVPEGYFGVLTHVGVMVSPNSAFNNVKWQLCSSGDADPWFAPNPFFFEASTLATLLPFYKVFPSQRTIQLKVLNQTIGEITVSTVLDGFFRPLRSIPIG